MEPSLKFPVYEIEFLSEIIRNIQIYVADLSEILKFLVLIQKTKEIYQKF